MAFVLYEIWIEDTNGRQTLHNTTGSMAEAIQTGKDAIAGTKSEAIIFQDDGGADDFFEMKRIKNT